MPNTENDGLRAQHESKQPEEKRAPGDVLQQQLSALTQRVDAGDTDAMYHLGLYHEFGELFDETPSALAPVLINLEDERSEVAASDRTQWTAIPKRLQQSRHSQSAKSLRIARGYYRQAMLAGNEEATLRLVVLSLRDVGQREMPWDLQRRLKELSRKGNSGATVLQNVSLLAANRNSPKAVRLLTKAVRQGSASALLCLDEDFFRDAYRRLSPIESAILDNDRLHAEFDTRAQTGRPLTLTQERVRVRRTQDDFIKRNVGMALELAGIRGVCIGWMSLASRTLREAADDRGGDRAKILKVLHCYEEAIALGSTYAKLLLILTQYDHQQVLGIELSDIGYVSKVRELAAQGCQKALFTLAQLTEQGRGAHKDLNRAVRLYRLSYLGGYAPGFDELRRLCTTQPDTLPEQEEATRAILHDRLYSFAIGCHDILEEDEPIQSWMSFPHFTHFRRALTEAITQAEFACIMKQVLTGEGTDESWRARVYSTFLVRLMTSYDFVNCSEAARGLLRQLFCEPAQSGDTSRWLQAKESILKQVPLLAALRRTQQASLLAAYSESELDESRREEIARLAPSSHSRSSRSTQRFFHPLCEARLTRESEVATGNLAGLKAALFLHFNSKERANPKPDIASVYRGLG